MQSHFIPGGTDKGKAWLEGDKLCFQFQLTFLGMVYCGATFKNPKGSPEGKDEYVRFTDFGPATFSKTK